MQDAKLDDAATDGAIIYNRYVYISIYLVYGRDIRHSARAACNVTTGRICLGF